MTRHRPFLLAASLPLLLLAACGKDNTSTAANDPLGSMQATIEGAEKAAAEAGATPTGDAPLQPGQTVQGTIEADAGTGMQSFRSLSTKVADDLDRQIAGKVESNAKVQAAIEDGNRKLAALGTDMRMDSKQVESMIGSMAGKTFHDSTVMHVGIIKQQAVNLQGRAADGSVIQLSLNFDDANLGFQDGSISFQPDPKSVLDRYSTDAENPPTITIERFEKNPDGSFALAGSFKAVNMAAIPMAKKLKGRSLPSVSGRFAFDALPAKEMPKFGR